MGQKITLGGQRLGAGGERIKQELRNYERSTHDLSESIVTSMSCGTLTPFMVKPLLRGDTIEINTDAACRTIPTKGPLFGSYKLQGDFFFCPVRLYQALLHNNPVDIAMDMDKVMLPTITIRTARGAQEDAKRYGKFNLSSLVKYCGMSGLGRSADASITAISREIQAVPMLGYYDIYKNYYANKQEESGKVISIKTTGWQTIDISNIISIEQNVTPPSETTTNYTISLTEWGGEMLTKGSLIAFYTDTKENAEKIYHMSFHINTEELTTATSVILRDIIQQNKMTFEITRQGENFVFVLNLGTRHPLYNNSKITNLYISKKPGIAPYSKDLDILDFPLKNLDDMRYKILTHHEFGVPFKLGNGDEFDWHGTSGESGNGLPYSTLFSIDYEGKTANKYPMNGLCLKTYQNDIYNTWLNSEIIDGEGGVNELTKVQVQDGAFMVNALLYAEKLYELYNRIAATDGSYDSWLDVVYDKEDRISHEKPLYLGGFYNEIVFEEIVQSAPADGDPLGELGGKGRLADKTKGGKLIFKASEIGFLIGIVSITPRIYYTQQNEFYMTDIKSMDDFHKPGLDQIGFQDLIGERLCFEDTVLNGSTIIHRSKVGKLPAWLEYQTSVDKAFGDLAEPNGNGYMILNRNYETDENGIVDATTYIDPTKYNYAFAYTALDSQNFWVQCRSKVIARRKMSANLLPNI